MLKRCTVSNKIKLIASGTMFLLAVLIYMVAKYNEWVAEFIFARGIYRAVSTIFNRVTGIVPFSVIEVIIVLLSIIIMVKFIRFIILLIRRKSVKKKVAGFLCNLSVVLGTVALLYVTMCGTNYFRYSFARINNIEITEHSDEELYEMCIDIARRMNVARAEIEENEEGVADYSLSYLEMAKAVRKEFEKTAKEYDCLNGCIAGAKPLSTSYIFSCFETTGIYSPFTVEANVNIDIMDHKIPVTMAHEMAHVSGFMREDEANYIAYLVCTGSEDPRIVYSGLSIAFSYSMNQLYGANEEYYYDVWNQVGEKVAADMSANSEYWSQFEDKTLAQVGNEVNNAYLKANDQSDGVKSYGRMVDLLLSTYFQ